MGPLPPGAPHKALLLCEGTCTQRIVDITGYEEASRMTEHVYSHVSGFEDLKEEDYGISVGAKA
jgi:hypothetical protein